MSKSNKITKRSWTEYQNEAMRLVLQSGETDFPRFVHAYRAASSDAVHTPGGIMTHARKVAGILKMELPTALVEAYNAWYRRGAKDEDLRGTTSDAPVGLWAGALSQQPGFKADLPKLPAGDVWLIAGEIGKLLKKDHRWVGAHAPRLFGESARHRATYNGKPQWFYKGSAVLKHLEGPSTPTKERVQKVKEAEVPGREGRPVACAKNQHAIDDSKTCGHVRSAPTLAALHAAWKNGVITDGEFLRKADQVKG